MKNYWKILYLVLILLLIVSLNSCSLFNKNKQNTNNAVTYEEELTSSTGKWYLLDENKIRTNTYFEFDGSKSKMNFNYYEEDTLKSSGKYRIISRNNDGNNSSSITIILKRSNVDKEDWIGCYVDDFDTNFTQFTTIFEEQDLGMNDGRIYTHIYRLNENPYKFGTYLLENKEYKVEKDAYRNAGTKQVEDGLYKLNEDTSIRFYMPKPHHYALFEYRYKDTVIDGVYNIASDKKTIYLYIENDPYQYIRLEDRKNYDTTFSTNYPPDFYLRGNFEVIDGKIQINSLYHHTYSPTKIEDSVWKFGTYVK